jgi:trigger factor
VHAEKADHAAESGDRVTLDFTGRIDSVAFDGGSAKDFAFVIGEKRMLPEFEAAALGMKAGETKSFPLAFPADYHGKDVAGKTAEFEITVSKVEAGVLPEVDAEFAKQLGIEDGDLAKMREDIRGNLQREVSTRVRSLTKESVMEALVKVSELEVPKSLVEQDVQRLVEQAREDLKKRGMKMDNMPIPPDMFQAQAERRVRLGLILADLVKQNNLQARQDQIRAKIEDFSQSYEQPAQVMAWYLSDKRRLADVEAVVLEDNVVNWVLTKAKVTDKKVSFEELMGTRDES